MASAFYSGGLDGFLAGEIDWDTGNIKAILLRGGAFTATHKFLSELKAVTGVEEVSRSPSLATKAIGVAGGLAAGVVDAADTAWASVPTGTACNAFVLVQTNLTGGADNLDTGVRLISYHDDYTGLPVTPNGANINLAFPNDANRIFKI